MFQQAWTDTFHLLWVKISLSGATHKSELSIESCFLKVFFPLLIVTEYFFATASGLLITD